ncbi:MAG: hypothetical protein IJZ85_11120 [Lachnospiraceae bacterium]|nr:hypothetical protein [Lachnospiraceae bacterium]
MNRKLIIEDDSVYEIDEACMKKKDWEKQRRKSNNVDRAEHVCGKKPGNGAANKSSLKKQ